MTIPTADSVSISRSHQYVGFLVGNELYGVSITQVQEIIRCGHLTRVPQAPAFIAGVLNLRGRVLPVVDLRKRLGLPARDYDASTRIVVVDVRGKAVGLAVDAVREVLAIPESDIAPGPPLQAGVYTELVCGTGKVGQGLIILLDINNLLAPGEESAAAAGA